MEWNSECLKVRFYPAGEIQFPISSARRDRKWMSNNIHSYRCTPMTVANSYGWDIISPKNYDIEWDGDMEPWNDGKNKKSHMKVFGDGIERPSEVDFHLGSGTLSFKIGWTPKLSKGWGIMLTDVPNKDYNGWRCLTAIIEVDKFTYPIMPSIQLDRPGKISIKKGEVFCRLIPVPMDIVADSDCAIEEAGSDIIEYIENENRERVEFFDSPDFPEKKQWRKKYKTETANHPKFKMPKLLKKR
jgi:hypothetical protein